MGVKSTGVTPMTKEKSTFTAANENVCLAVRVSGMSSPTCNWNSSSVIRVGCAAH